MYNKKQIAEKISLFQKSRDELIIISYGVLLKYDSQFNKIYEEKIYSPFGGIYNESNHIFLWEQKQLFDLNSRDYITVKIDNCLFFEENHILSLIYTESYTESQVCLYDFLKGEFEWKTPMSSDNEMFPNFCNGVFFVHVKKGKYSVKTIDFKTGQLLWNFNLESLHQEYDLFSEKWNKPMEIANFCGIANEVLWMDVVCRGIGNFLLGLDVNTGQPVHLLDKAENRFMVYPFDMIPTDGRTTYDAKRNILFGFAPDWVHWQVDLSDKSPKIKMWDLSEEMTKHHAFVSAYMNCGISDSHIFFPVGSLGSTPQVFALNRETLKVDWQYHFTEGGQYFTPTKVEVTDTHLYVLDNTGTLHIFEKEENS